MNVALILSSLGGIIAFLSGAALIFRGIIRNVGATRENTLALQTLSNLFEKMRTEFDDMKIRMAIMEDRRRR